MNTYKNAMVVAIVGLAVLLLSAPQLQAGGQNTIIDFDDLSAPVVVEDQYSEATFSARVIEAEGKGDDFVVCSIENSSDYGTSLPNMIAAVPETVCSKGGGEGKFPPGIVVVDFTGPVNDLTVVMSGDQLREGAGRGLEFGLVRIWENGSFSADVYVGGDGNPTTSHMVDLTEYTNVTKIELSDAFKQEGVPLDFVVWDDIAFNVQAVPTMNIWGLLALITVLALVGAFFRARQTQQV